MQSVIPPGDPMSVYVSDPIAVEAPLPAAQDITCSCGATVTFDAGEHYARCFNAECGEYHHR